MIEKNQSIDCFVFCLSFIFMFKKKKKLNKIKKFKKKIENTLSMLGNLLRLFDFFSLKIKNLPIVQGGPYEGFHCDACQETEIKG